MTVQVEIRVPASTNGERLLVRPVFPDGELAGAEEIIGTGERATFFVYEGIRLEFSTSPANAVPVPAALELEAKPVDDGRAPHLDLRTRRDGVPA